MRRSKRRIRAFVDHLFGIYSVPHIPVIIKWHHNSLMSKNGASFGVYCYDIINGEYMSICIYVAAKQIKTSATFGTIAHEFVHYLQHLHGRDMSEDAQIERDAEYWGKVLYDLWLVGDKHTAPNVWEVTS